MSRFRHHKYIWTKPFGSVRHHWELVGPDGGVHFHVSINEQYGDSCGLEFHHGLRCGFYKDRAPDHINCPLLGGPCWHDGTSHYASEHVWPLVKPLLRGHEHEAIFRFLETEYDNRFGAPAEKEDAA